MNPRYFELPKEKQDTLVNAGYKTFAKSPYQKASMASAAEEAGLSKSLLFYYFRNKKEYYMYLYDTAFRFLNEQLSTDTSARKDGKADLFEMLEETIEKRSALLLQYPYILRFAATAYYATEEEVSDDIADKKGRMFAAGKKELLRRIDRTPFENPADAPDLLDIIVNVAEGCLRGCEDLAPDKIRKMLPEFRRMMRSLKEHYYKKT